MLTDKPSAPQNLRVTAVNKDSVTLAWDEPDHNGGAPVKRYVVEKADVKRGVFSEAGDTDPATRQFKVGKLLEGNDYMFRVSAENEIGQGKPASLAEPVTAKLPFGKLVMQIYANICKIIYANHLFIIYAKHLCKLCATINMFYSVLNTIRRTGYG